MGYISSLHHNLQTQSSQVTHTCAVNIRSIYQNGLLVFDRAADRSIASLPGLLQGLDHLHNAEMHVLLPVLISCAKKQRVRFYSIVH